MMVSVQVWDRLAMDTDVHLPEGARVKVTLRCCAVQCRAVKYQETSLGA